MKNFEEQSGVQIAQVEYLGRRAALQLRKNRTVTFVAGSFILVSLMLCVLMGLQGLWLLVGFSGLMAVVFFLAFSLTLHTRRSLIHSLIELNGTLHLLTQRQRHILEPLEGFSSSSQETVSALQRRIAAGLADPISLREREQLEELEKAHRRRFGQVKLMQSS